MPYRRVSFAVRGIHPFIGGNGRTGRLIVDLEFMRAGYLPVDIKFTDRARYYDAFNAYYVRGDARPMTLLLMEYEKDRLKSYFAMFDSNGRHD